MKIYLLYKLNLSLVYLICMLVYSKYPNGLRPSNYWEKKRKITLISCSGEINCSRKMKRNILYISKSFPSHTGRWITCRRWRNDIMLIHVVHGQGSIK
ncbi:BnaA06g09670D [Brassica napus]|uniref:BnaA06g09670D protein n=1 Tax=Brassica napus TaxID=3708 RepID=A0A078I5E2_BRANA|nr:BnaA06g09670D [Brassica napus]